MFCQKHENDFFTSAGGPCSLCGNNTNSQFKLCDRCSTGLDQCEVCRADLNSGRSPLLIKAFKSAEMTAALNACRQADLDKQKAFQAANAVFEPLCLPAQARLEAALAPFKEKQAALEKPFLDEYIAVGDETRAVEADPQSTAGQRLDAKNRWSAAMNKFSQASRPFRNQFDIDVKPIYEQYQQEIAPFEAVRKAACEKAITDCDQIKHQANAKIDVILKRANSRGARFVHWLSSFFGG